MQIIIDDALSALKKIESETFDMCVTSPPYYGLRDYDASGQIGLEKDPEAYIKKLVLVFREVRRTLKNDGTLWVNIGDSYATRSGAQPPTNTRNTLGHTVKTVPSGYKAKDLIGIPWMLAFALRNDGWYLRQDIIWQKPNGMPESVRDRCTKSHEYIFLLSKNRRYYFDAEAISEPISESTIKRLQQNIEKQKGSTRLPGKTNAPMKAATPRFGWAEYGDSKSQEPGTKSEKEHNAKPRRNKRDVWTINTAGFKGAHFAVFPEKLAEICILAGSRKGGVVLDPFVGSGTSGVVAVREKRDFVGIDVSPKFCEISEKRIAQEMQKNREVTAKCSNG